MSAHSAFGPALAHFGGAPAPVDAARSHIRALEARIEELTRKLAFQHEATAQLAAQIEELCPHTITAEMPDGSEVPAPAEVVRAALVWLREKHDLEFSARVDDQSLLHFEVERAEARIAAATCVHSWRLIEDSEGDVNVINGTRHFTYLECRRCGEENGDHEAIARFRRGGEV